MVKVTQLPVGIIDTKTLDKIATIDAYAADALEVMRAAINVAFRLCMAERDKAAIDHNVVWTGIRKRLGLEEGKSYIIDRNTGEVFENVGGCGDPDCDGCGAEAPASGRTH